MTAAIARLSGPEAYDLIYTDHLAKLSVSDQATMKVAMENSSRVWIGYDGDTILACWGVQAPSLLSDRAYLWLWTTEHLDSHVFIFIRHSQRAVADMLREFSALYGVTVADNHRAIRWLRWLGAEFEPPRQGLTTFEIRAGGPHG